MPPEGGTKTANFKTYSSIMTTTNSIRSKNKN